MSTDTRTIGLQALADVDRFNDLAATRPALRQLRPAITVYARALHAALDALRADPTDADAAWQFQSAVEALDGLLATAWDIIKQEGNAA